MKNHTLHRSCRLFFVVFFGLCLGLAARAQGLSYLMKITGPEINGQSVIEGYENQIEVASYSLSGYKQIESGGGSVPTAGSFQFNGLECVMTLDGKAYPVLLTRMATGGLLTEVVFSGVSFSGPTSRVFFKLEMKEVLIETMSQQGTNGDQPIVSINFRPSAMRITTTYLNPNGSESDPVVFQWSFVTGTAVY